MINETFYGNGKDSKMHVGNWVHGERTGSTRVESGRIQMAVDGAERVAWESFGCHLFFHGHHMEPYDSKSFVLCRKPSAIVVGSQLRENCHGYGYDRLVEVFSRDEKLVYGIAVMLGLERQKEPLTINQTPIKNEYPMVRTPRELTDEEMEAEIKRILDS